MDFLLILLGFAGLLIGGEFLVRGAVSVAQRFQIPPMVIGLTLVGFGTSMPELVTSLQAAFAGAPGIAVGNVVGSNMANILLILGAAAVIAPISINRGTFWRDAIIMCLATAALVGFTLTGEFGRVAGLVFIAGLVAFLVIALRSGKIEEDDDLPPSVQNMPLALGMFVGGLIVTLLGAKFLVQGAVSLATAWGVSDAVIGLTIVAIGTSLPELVTSIVAARKGHSDVAYGNVIGSNIFNILGILGITALVKPIPVPPEILHFDIWALTAVTLLMVAVSASSWRITRAEGAGMLMLYFAYLGWLAIA